jgi:release factor glutamine methyltransferase
VTVAGSIRLDLALQSAARALRAVSDSPSLDAQTLLAHIMDRDRSWLLAHPEHLLDQETSASFDLLINRVKLGEALPYVIGERWFFGRLFSVDSHVLIPRPETELLVESALTYLRSNMDRRRAVDVGTGSGCIAVSLCAELPYLEMIAIDRSYPAIKVARRNAEIQAVDKNIDFIVGDLLEPVETEFDLMCANLPYIPSGRLASLQVAQREPLDALDGGEEGLEYIIQLVHACDRSLAQDGCLLLEIDETQGSRVMEEVQCLYPDWEVVVEKDLAGLDRLLIAKKGR